MMKPTSHFLVFLQGFFLWCLVFMSTPMAIPCHESMEMAQEVCDICVTAQTNLEQPAVFDPLDFKFVAVPIESYVYFHDKNPHPLTFVIPDQKPPPQNFATLRAKTIQIRV